MYAPSHMKYNLLDYGIHVTCNRIKSLSNVCSSLPAFFSLSLSVAFEQDSCSYFVVPIFTIELLCTFLFSFQCLSFRFSACTLYTLFFFALCCRRYSLEVSSLHSPNAFFLLSVLVYVIFFKVMLAFIYSPLYLVYGGLYRFCF